MPMPKSFPPLEIYFILDFSNSQFNREFESIVDNGKHKLPGSERLFFSLVKYRSFVICPEAARIQQGVAQPIAEQIAPRHRIEAC
jgi:hypothetical protein